MKLILSENTGNRHNLEVGKCEEFSYNPWVMGKKRRTRKQKIRTQKSLQQREIVGFKIKDKDLGFLKKNSKQDEKSKKTYGSYLRVDLTKTVGLTILAVALELALWHFAFK